MERTIHFVGFRGDEYARAVQIWGVPDFVHRIWDQRAWAESRDENAIVIFASAREWMRRNEPSEHVFDDSAVM